VRAGQITSSVDFLVWYSAGGDPRYRPSISLDRDDVSHGMPYEGDEMTPGPHTSNLQGLIGNGCETGLLLPHAAYVSPSSRLRVVSLSILESLRIQQTLCEVGFLLARRALQSVVQRNKCRCDGTAMPRRVAKCDMRLGVYMSNGNSDVEKHASRLLPHLH
jgi:hypothetical protein